MMNAHHPDHHHHGSSSVSMLAWAIVITLGFAAVEAIAGFHSHSLALMGDAGHMGSDALALLIALLATWISQKPPTQSHSYGLGRAEVIAGTTSSLFMFAIAIGIVVESIARFQLAQSVNAPVVMGVGSLGIVINFLVAYLLSRGQQTLNVRAAMLHVIGDILGSIAAVTSGAIIYFTGWLPADPIMSILISILIAYSSIRLLREAIRILMEGVPLNINIEQLKSRMCEISSIKSIHDLHVWTLSSGKIAISAHIKLHNIVDWESTLRQTQKTLESEFGIQHITLQPESGITKGCKHCDE